MQLVGQNDVFLTVPENQPLKLDCQIIGQLQPTYSWSKQGSCVRSFNVTGSIVHVTDRVTMRDAGTYVCNASSGDNVLTQTCQVAVNRSGFEEKCDFENGNLCGWRQDTSDVFDWMFQSGSTQTANSGPSWDITTLG
ncbi:hypothetical protein DPMN_152157 [Dreissena polymorpha]|uniref:Ig-like domain-containing protein n=2 Tax=Dreissena polymorpha TaxID=45954 RepID=A0A9D4FMI6_DREPO|nr:hypothetical protein DPMN_152157 [Dreissena polymorpha]